MSATGALAELTSEELDEVFGGANSNPGYGYQTAEASPGQGPSGNNYHGLDNAFYNTPGDPYISPGNGRDSVNSYNGPP